ncbi:putative adenylate kinase 5, chloroplastic [Vitis vinifera]|uniref:Putative adenylate kinase 5, chloroplastic n=1 Tax=Vitis vinifera TaxID=29760 RepID=A0A438J836_VITVI|nr:putative adenylate kinase 5, chloroplastic [Vitis vinifera]
MSLLSSLTAILAIYLEEKDNYFLFVHSVIVVCREFLFKDAASICKYVSNQDHVNSLNLSKLTGGDQYSRTEPRNGTLMELVRVLALSFADDGKHVKNCCSSGLCSRFNGEGALAGMPLQLAGTRKILEFMDWGDYGAKGTFINIGSIGSKEVEEQDDLFILVAPQNAVGNCIIDDLKAMTDAAGNRPVILVNPSSRFGF